MLAATFLVLFSITPQKADARVGVNISFQTFYDNLAPYGSWFNDPQYGYVWAPRVERGFRPYYTNGYWVNTDYGNMWMSDYSWGWAAFHYGRWAYSEMYGWIWVPGDEWGPAWVTWRQGGGYYGWAPMRPGISINISFGSGYYVPDAYWTFIPYRNIYGHNFHRYYSPRRTTTIIRNTTVINNTYINNRNTYVTGPRRSEVERTTGRSVRTYQINNLRDEGHSRLVKNSVAVYRPEVSRQNANSRVAPRPRQVETVDRGSHFREASVVTPERTTTQIQRNQKVENSPSDVRSSRPIQTTRNLSDSRNANQESVNQGRIPSRQLERENRNNLSNPQRSARPSQPGTASRHSGFSTPERSVSRQGSRSPSANRSVQRSVSSERSADVPGKNNAHSREKKAPSEVRSFRR